MKEDKPKQSDPLEILEALRDTTNPKRRSLDRDMLARKAAFLEIIKRGTEPDFIQAPLRQRRGHVGRTATHHRVPEVARTLVAILCNSASARLTSSGVIFLTWASMTALTLSASRSSADRGTEVRCAGELFNRLAVAPIVGPFPCSIPAPFSI